MRRNQNINIQLVKACLERDIGGKEEKGVHSSQEAYKGNKKGIFANTLEILKKKQANEYLNRKRKKLN